MNVAGTSQPRPVRRAAQAPQAAFVLHGYDWSESSLILDLFTRESGRIAVAAKGAKKPYSQMRAVLMPFQRIAVQLGKSRGDDSAEVHNLRSAEWAGQGVSLEGAAWFAGFYINELLMKLLARDDAHPRLFEAYALSLRCLSGATPNGIEAVLRGFELMLLRETGVLPQLDRVTSTQAALANGHAYALRPEQGLVETADAESTLRADSCVALERALAVVQQSPSADALHQLHAASADALAGLKVQLRQQLHYHLGGATLRTRQVMIDSFRLLGLDASASSR